MARDFEGEDSQFAEMIRMQIHQGWQGGSDGHRNHSRTERPLQQPSLRESNAMPGRISGRLRKMCLSVLLT